MVRIPPEDVEEPAIEASVEPSGASSLHPNLVERVEALVAFSEPLLCPLRHPSRTRIDGRYGLVRESLGSRHAFEVLKTLQQPLEIHRADLVQGPPAV